MAKPASTLTISRAAEAAGVNVETLRYYQRRGFIRQPPKPARGYRVYPAETVDRIRFIKRAQELGFTLAEIKSLLSLGDGHCHETRELAERKLLLIRGRMRDLKAMERVLDTLVQACGQHGDGPGCPLIDTLGRPARA